MQANRTVFGLFLALILVLVAGPAAAAGERKIDFEPDKAGRGASGEAVIADKGDGQKEVTISARGLKPNAVYSVWLVTMKPKMDMAGLGEPDFVLETDGRGSGRYSATIGSADLARWELLELAYHPSGDPKNTKEFANIALKAKIRE